MGLRVFHDDGCCFSSRASTDGIAVGGNYPADTAGAIMTYR
jgi:hypothetical protein